MKREQLPSTKPRPSTKRFLVMETEYAVKPHLGLFKKLLYYSDGSVETLMTRDLISRKGVQHGIKENN